MRTERWTVDGERFAVIDYNSRDVAEVSREAMHLLMRQAGFVLVEPTEETQP